MEDWKLELIKRIKEKIINAHSHIDRSFTVDFNNLNNKYSLKDKQKRIKLLHENFYLKNSLFFRYKKVLNSLILSSHFDVHIKNYSYSFIDVSSDIFDLALKELIDAYETFQYKNQIVVNFIPYYVDSLFKNKDFALFKDICSDYRENEMFAGVGFLPDLDCENNDKKRLYDYFNKVFNSFIDIGDIYFHIDQENNPQSQQTNILLSFISENFKNSKLNNNIRLVHVLSPSSYSETDFEKHIDKLKEFKDKISIIVCPIATLSNEQNRDICSPTHNSIARVLDYYNKGIKINIGIDNVEDMFIPFNTYNIIDQVFVMANAIRYYNLDFYSEILENDLVSS